MINTGICDGQGEFSLEIRSHGQNGLLGIASNHLGPTSSHDSDICVGNGLIPVGIRDCATNSKFIGDGILRGLRG